MGIAQFLFPSQQAVHFLLPQNNQGSYRHYFQVAVNHQTAVSQDDIFFVISILNHIFQFYLFIHFFFSSSLSCYKLSKPVIILSEITNPLISLTNLSYPKTHRIFLASAQLLLQTHRSPFSSYRSGCYLVRVLLLLLYW